MAQQERERPAGGPKPSDWIAALVKDPRNPPEIVELCGYLGASSEDGRMRIYLDSTLQNYVEVLREKILHVEPIPDDKLGLSRIFLAADAQVFLPEQPPKLEARAIFGGGVYQDYLNVAPPGAAVGPVEAICYPLTRLPPFTIYVFHCPTRQFPCTYRPPCPTRWFTCRPAQCSLYLRICGWPPRTRFPDPQCTWNVQICYGHIPPDLGNIPEPYAAAQMAQPQMAQPMGGAAMAAGVQQAALPPTIPVWRCHFPSYYLVRCTWHISPFCTRYPIWGCFPPPPPITRYGPLCPGGGGPITHACTYVCDPGGGFDPPDWGMGMAGFDQGAAFGGGYDPYAGYQAGY